MAKSQYRTIEQMPMFERPLPVSRTADELRALIDDEANGELPPGTIADLERRIAENTFGVGFKRDARGKPIEQGIGSAANPSRSHFEALRIRERAGDEPAGVYFNAVAELWKRDPAMAEKLGLPPIDNLPKRARPE